MELSDAEDNMTEIPPSGELPLCDTCKSDNKDTAAIWHCLACDKHMCQLCYNIHVDFGGGGDCRVVKLGDPTDAVPLPDNKDASPCSNVDDPSSNMPQEPSGGTENGAAVTTLGGVSQAQDTSVKTVPSVTIAQVVVSDDENEINHSSTPETTASSHNPAVEETSQQLGSPPEDAPDTSSPPADTPDTSLPADAPVTSSPLSVKPQKTIQVKKSSTQLRTVNEISAVAVDGNTQEIYVVSHSSKLVMRFKADGTFVRKFASQGANKVKEPWDVAILPNGNIAITDREDKVLKLYNNTNRLLKVFKDVAEPRGVATDPIGNIYVADQETHNIYVFQETHKSCIKVIKPSGCTLITPDFLIINGKKELIVSDAGDDSIKVLSTSGQEASLLFQYGTRGSDWHQLKFPRGVASNSRFEIFVADCYNDRVIVLNMDGSYKQTLLTSADSLVEPQGLEMTKDGKLIVATKNGDLLIYQVKKTSGFCAIL